MDVGFFFTLATSGRKKTTNMGIEHDWTDDLFKTLRFWGSELSEIVHMLNWNYNHIKYFIYLYIIIMVKPKL